MFGSSMTGNSRTLNVPMTKEVRKFAWCVAAAAFMSMGVPPALAQQVTVSNCANPLLGPNAQAIGCRLSELIDANGGTISIEPSITPLVRVDFEQFAFNPNSVGAMDTDPANISVVAIGLHSNKPGLQFTDLTDQWKVQGGTQGGGFLLNLKHDVIEYRVVARDPQTGQAVARIKGAEARLAPGMVTSTNPNEPARDLIRDIVSDDLGSSVTGQGGLQVFKSTDANAGERLQEAKTFSPQLAVRVLKEVRPEPGSDVNSVSEIENVRQYVFVSADKEVGCVPGTMRRATGGQSQVEFCALPGDQQIQTEAGPFARGNPAIGFGFGFGTGDLTTGGGSFWHDLGWADNWTSLVDHITDIGAVFPQDPGDGSFNDVREFDGNDAGQISYAVNNVPPSGLIDFLVANTDLQTGSTSQVIREGDTINIGGVSHTVRATFGNRTTNNTVFVNVSLTRNGAPSADGVIGFDLAKIIDGSGPVIMQAYLTGAPLDTPGGTERLGEVINVIAAQAISNHAVLHSFEFTTTQQIFMLRNGRRSAANLVAETGDIVNGAGDQVRTFRPAADVDSNGNVAIVARIAPQGSNFPTGSAAGFSSIILGTIWGLTSGTEVPGVPGSTIVDVLAFGIGDNGRGALTVSYRESGQALVKVALLSFTFDATTGQPAWSPPVLTTGDTIDADGVARVVDSIVLDPRGVGDAGTALAIGLSDGSDAVIHIPANPVIAVVPDVTGFDQVSAEAAIVNAGLNVGTITNQSSSTVPAGDVISQSPPPGSEVGPGGVVDLVVSSGAALAVVPDLLGLNQTTAEADIVAAGLVLGTVSTLNSSTAPAGEVIGQNPAGLTQVPFGTPVDLTVSAGPAQARGDVDGDGDVDRDDVGLILFARNQPASGPDDPRDLNGDGTITVLDARQAALMCTRPGCATQ